MKDRIIEKIKNKTINWKKDSWDVAKYCSQHLDAEKYNWKVDSSVVAKYCPEYLAGKKEDDTI